MSNGNQQNKPLLRAVTSLTILGGIAAGFGWACTSSSSDNKGTGGAAADTGGYTSNTNVGGNTSNSNVGGSAGTATNGGSPSTGGAKGTGGSSAVACTFDAGLASGAACTASPATFALDPTGCAFGTWNMTSGVLSGGLAVWGGLTQDCTGGSYHVTGSYNGYLVANSGGNAGFNTYYNAASDAGLGCAIVGASNYSGLTLDVNVVAVPSNELIVGVHTADGNQAETTVALNAGQQTVKLTWAQIRKKSDCGPPTGSNITTIYYVFLWFSDSATHAVDATFSNIGFY